MGPTQHMPLRVTSPFTHLGMYDLFFVFLNQHPYTATATCYLYRARRGSVRVCVITTVSRDPIPHGPRTGVVELLYLHGPPTSHNATVDVSRVSPHVCAVAG